ncbi:MAG: HsdM family class I SAM-dependent methyltransferase [Brevinemataceae bacterium]
MSSVNERITEDIVRDWLKSDSLYEKLKVEEQKSKSPKIQKLLKNASKSGSGLGKPEFLVSDFVKPYDNLLLVIECKAETKYHESKTGDQYSQYAVDGVKLYASYLSKEYDVIAIAVSGEDEKDLKISYSYWKNGHEDNSLSFKEDHFYKIEELQEILQPTIVKTVALEELRKFAQKLNVDLHKYNVPEDKRVFLMSGILLALDNPQFEKGYNAVDKDGKKQSPEKLAKSLVNTITSELSDKNVALLKKDTLTEQYKFIELHHDLTEFDESLEVKQQPQKLEQIITDINTNVKQYLNANKGNTIDAIGEMYTEFLRYANNDSNLGIVLTPPHVTDLMCELVDLKVSKDHIDTVVDTCCGTGGFLIAAMTKMIEKAKGDQEIIKKIKEKHLVGIELQANIHALACANMILHGDGKSHVIQGNSFDLSSENQKSLSNKPLNKALLNPPYKKGASQIVQLEFIERACNLVQTDGLCCAIVQMSCGIKSDTKQIRNRILKKHTLEAVISMPDDLFYPTGVVTCIMIFKAHSPHPTNKKTWFGYLKDDGFEKRKNVGRVDYRGKWQDIKQEFLDLYTNREVKSGLSVLQQVTGDDEWCAEAYMETDYTQLTQEDFKETLRKYASFLVMQGDRNETSDS